MNKTAIIIPSRLNALRLPNKPLKLIGGKEMILHVYDAAIEAEIGDVIVATPDVEIFSVVKKYGGHAQITRSNHKTGSDRIFEVFENELKKSVDTVINLQGDMPNINSKSIKNLADHLNRNSCEIATLASKLDLKKEVQDKNICKVVTTRKISQNSFAEALDFYRLSTNVNFDFTYHHIGIYAFTNKALMRYVGLKRSKLEISRNLEQLRALENKMKVNVGYTEELPLSVDTEEDFLKVKKIMENK